MRILIDTGALIALGRARDQYHERALELAHRHLAAGGRFVGTTMILGEAHAHLLHLRGPAEARGILTRLLNDPAHEWVEVPADLVSEAVVNWLDRFDDQGFTLVDAVSFELMRREGLREAFSFDGRFPIAGFELFG